MEKLIACCGLVCTDCEAYKATQKNDDKLRKEIADKWSKEYGHEMKLEDVNCVGCTAEGQHIGYCGMCEIRSCVQSKSLKNCGMCRDYACEKITAFFKNAPHVKKNLDAIKQKSKL